MYAILIIFSYTIVKGRGLHGPGPALRPVADGAGKTGMNFPVGRADKCKTDNSADQM